MITYIDPLALALNAPHPNAGKLLIGFILSKEGQTILAAQGTIPSRADVESQVLRVSKGTRLAPATYRWRQDTNPPAKNSAKFSCRVITARPNAKYQDLMLRRSASTRTCKIRNHTPHRLGYSALQAAAEDSSSRRTEKTPAKCHRKGVKSAFCFLLRRLQSSELFAEAASPSPLAPSSANRPSSPTTFSLVQPLPISSCL